MTEAKTPQTQKAITLSVLFARFRLKILVTWCLVVAEAGTLLLFPLFMGMAIDDYLKSEYAGLMALVGVGLLSLILGAGRRFYDTRIYARIYSTITPEMVEQEEGRGAPVSVIAARANMTTEFVEFLENTFPEIIDSVIALVGTLVILAFLDLKVFGACVVATTLIGLVYAATSKKTYALNKGYNDELERRVEVLEKRDKASIAGHFKATMRWNIRLSDLETMNFSASWVLLIGVLAYSIVASIQDGVTTHGKVLAILMYVFNYIESVITIPLFYQQSVRLKEISHRLE